MTNNALRYRPPGLYRESDKNRYTPLSLPDTGIPGFVGITERGPTNRPQKVTSYEHFLRLFGNLGLDSYLAPAVQGYFTNGGRHCYVVRVANLSGLASGKGARHGGALLKNSSGKTAVQITAQSEGSWANDLRVTFRALPPRTQTLLTMDLKPGATSASIRSTHGFKRGTVVQFEDDDKKAYVSLSKVDSKQIFWNDPLDVEFRSDGPTVLEPVEFEIEIMLGENREKFSNLSRSAASGSYFARVINERSEWVKVLDLLPEEKPDNQLPAEALKSPLSGGRDGIDSLTPSDFIGDDRGPGERYGLKAFEFIHEIDLLCIPDLMWCLGHTMGFRTEKHVEIVQHEMIGQAERCRDRIAILELPEKSDYKDALGWRTLFDSSYGALYFPWLEIERDGTLQRVPPSGHVAGIISRTDEEIGAHAPPANQDIRGVVDVSQPLSPDDAGMLNGDCVNAVRPMNARGIRVWGARTLSSDPMLRYINVQRVLATLVRALRRDLQWVVFEPNVPALWKIITRDITLFLTQLWRDGMFRGNTPEDAFYVKCNAETNSEEERDAGRVVVEIGVSPVRPAEYIVFRMRQELEKPDLD